MPNVLFAHGKEGSITGTKATMIRNNFAEVKVPKLINSYKAEDFVKDWRMVEHIAAAGNIDVLVGSSRGGAIIAQTRVNIRKVLIAPAWKKFGVTPYLTKNDVILHSKQDDLVPYEDSVLLANLFGCTLIECGTSHRMSDKNTLEKIKNYIRGNKQNGQYN